MAKRQRAPRRTHATRPVLATPWILQSVGRVKPLHWRATKAAWKPSGHHMSFSAKPALCPVCPLQRLSATTNCIDSVPRIRFALKSTARAPAQAKGVCSKGPETGRCHWLKLLPREVGGERSTCADLGQHELMRRAGTEMASPLSAALFDDAAICFWPAQRYE